MRVAWLPRPSNEDRFGVGRNLRGSLGFYFSWLLDFAFWCVLVCHVLSLRELAKGSTFLELQGADSAQGVPQRRGGT